MKVSLSDITAGKGTVRILFVLDTTSARILVTLDL